MTTTTNITRANPPVAPAALWLIQAAPVYASDVGDVNATFNAGAVLSPLAKYRNLGDTAFIAANFTGTLKGVTPQYILVQYPVGISFKNLQQYFSDVVISINGVFDSGIGRTFSATQFAIYRRDRSLFPAFSLLNIYANLIQEMNF